MAETTNGRAAYIYRVEMDIPAEYEAEFNRIYDTDHVPTILKVPGVKACRRYRMTSSTCEDAPRYLALYEIDSPDVVTSKAWLAAVDQGDWAPKIRRHTMNRAHHVMQRIL